MRSKKFILIFGASSDISQYFIKKSKKIKNYNIVLTCRSKKNLDKLKKEFKHKKITFFLRLMHQK